MGIPTVRDTRPEQVERSALTGKTTLLLGAPAVSQPDALDGVACDTLEDALHAPSDELVVLDDFYLILQRSQAAHVDRLPSILDHAGGVCLVTRPRSLDWLVERDELPIDTFDAVDTAYLLRYDLSDSDEVARGYERCQSIWRATAGPEADQIERDGLRENRDRFEYPAYPFSSDLTDVLGRDEYGATLLPGLVAHFSDEVAGRVLTQQTLREAGSDLLEGLGMAAITSSVSTIGWGAVAAGGLAASTVTVPVSSLAFGGAGGILWWLSRDETPEGHEVRELLVETELLPDAEERLEIAYDLPPHTLDTLRELCAENPLSEIRRLEAEVEELQAIEDRLPEQHDLDEFVERLSALDDYTESPAAFDFLPRAIERAALDFEAFTDAVYEDERRLLQVSSGALTDTEIPYHGEEPDEIRTALESSDIDLVVVRGSHGSGKTTGIWKACEPLAEPATASEAAGDGERSYSIRVPDMARDPEFVAERLREADEPPVLVFSYGEQLVEDAAALRDEDLSLVWRWIEQGVCETAVVECREEFYGQFEAQFEQAPPGDRASPLNTDRAVDVPCELTDESAIESILEWSLDVLDWEGDVDRVVESATDIAEQNPEIAKIAARFEVASEEPIQDQDVESAHDLIWRDIDHFFGTDAGRCGEVLERIAAFRTTTSAALVETTSVATRPALTPCARSFGAYLDGDIRDRLEAAPEPTHDADVTPQPGDTWELVPSVYADVIFARRGLSNVRHYAQYVLHSDADPEHLVRLLRSVTIAYRRVAWGDQSADTARRTDLRSKADQLFAEYREAAVDPALYAQSLQVAISGGMAIDPTSIQVSTAEDVYHMGPERLFASLFGRLLRNAVPRFGATDDATEWLGRFRESVAAAAEAVDAELFRQNVYSTAVTALVDTFDDPNAVAEWLEAVDALVHQAAMETTDDVDSFPITTYAMTFAKLTRTHQDVEAVSDWLEQIDALVQDAAADADETDPKSFVDSVYSRSLGAMTDRHDDPAVLDGWIGYLGDLIRDAADPEPVPQLAQGRTYGLLLSNVALRHDDPSDAEPWLDRFDDQIQSVATVGDSDSFLGVVYAIALSDLAGRASNPADAAEWFERYDDMARASIADLSSDKGLSLAVLYGRAIGSLPEYYEDAGDASEWVDLFVRLASPVTEESILERDALEPTVVAEALADFTERTEDPESFDGWLAELDRALHSTAAESDESTTVYLQNAYALVFATLTERVDDPDDVWPWVEAVDAAATDAAGSDSDGESAYLTNLYANLFARLPALHDDPASVEDWIDRYDDLVSADAGSDPDGPVRFLTNHYGLTLKKLADLYGDPSTVAPWVARYDELTHAAAEDHSDDASGFLETVYSLALGTLAHQHAEPAAVEEWVDRIDALAHDAAVIESSGPCDFLADYYAKTVQQVADHYEDFAAASAWLEYIDELATDAGALHSEGVTQFLSEYLAAATVLVGEDSEEWGKVIHDRALATLDQSSMSTFYSEYCKCAALCMSLETFAGVAGAVVDRFVYAADPPVADEDCRADLLGSVVADLLPVLHPGRDGDPEYFNDAVDAVARIYEADEDLFDDVVEQVVGRLSDGNCSEWLVEETEVPDTELFVGPFLTTVTHFVLYEALRDVDSVGEAGRILSERTDVVRQHLDDDQRAISGMHRGLVLELTANRDPEAFPTGVDPLVDPGCGSLADHDAPGERADYYEAILDGFDQSPHHGRSCTCWLVHEVLDRETLSDGLEPEARVLAAALNQICAQFDGLDNRYAARLIAEVDAVDSAHRHALVESVATHLESSAFGFEFDLARRWRDQFDPPDQPAS